MIDPSANLQPIGAHPYGLGLIGLQSIVIFLMGTLVFIGITYYKYRQTGRTREDLINHIMEAVGLIMGFGIATIMFWVLATYVTTQI